MDRQQILLAKSLEAAQIPISIQSFDDRLVLQKAVYLLQSAGIGMGYRFRWYLRGPYSPEMTAAAYGIVSEGESAKDELSTWELDSKTKEIVESLKPLLWDKNLEKSERVRKLELLASILFLFKTEQAKPSDIEGTNLILRRNKKIYTTLEVKAGVRDLRTYGLL